MNFEKLLTKSWKDFVATIVNSILFVLLGIVLCLTVILIPTVVGGFTRSFLALVREGKKPAFGELLNFSNYLDILLMLLVGGLLISIGYMLLFIPGFILNIFWFYAIYFIVDKNMGFWQSLSASWDLVKTTGFFNHLVIILIIAVLTSVGSAIFFGIIFTAPYTLILAANTYVSVTEKETVAASE